MSRSRTEVVQARQYDSNTSKHPSGEHRPARHAGVMPWNTGPHKRKYLVSEGTALVETDGPTSGEFAFWGEWESESRFQTLPVGPAGSPRYVHAPFWQQPTADTFRQNTDPYVFGDCFRYTNCNQPYRGAPSWLQRLDRRSVLLFGGSLLGHFVIDTVFVVASTGPWSVQDTGDVANPTLRSAPTACGRRPRPR